MDVTFPATGHKETQAIVTALGDTLSGVAETRKASVASSRITIVVTGLYSRHRLVSELDAEIASCAESGTRSAVCLCRSGSVQIHQRYVWTSRRRSVAQACRGAAARPPFASDDFVARFGGDEFVMTPAGTFRDAQARRPLQSRFSFKCGVISHVEQGHVFHLQCSIGIAAITSTRFGTHELIAQADMACQTAKANGRNRVEFYNVSAKQSERMVQDIHWMRRSARLWRTMTSSLHYQPLMHIATRRSPTTKRCCDFKTSRGLIGPQTFLTGGRAIWLDGGN